MQALLLGVLALTAPCLTFARSGMTNEDSVTFVEITTAAPPPQPGVGKRSKDKIAVVVATLKDILQSTVNEGIQESALFSKHMLWCKTEGSGRASDIAESKTELANAKILFQEQLSSIDSLKLSVKKSEKEIEDANDAVAQAVALRTDENEKYTEELQMNTQSLRQIDTAIKHVSKVQKQGGFLQNGAMKKLQVNEPGESSYVFGVMRGLKAKLEKSQASLKQNEQDQVQMHNVFMETKGKTLKSLTDGTTERKILLTETSAKQSGVNRKVGQLTENVAKLLDSAGKTAAACDKTDQGWKVREADRVKEKAALVEAIAFLKDEAVTLQQVSLFQHRTGSADHQEDRSAEFVPSLLQVDAATSETIDSAFDNAEAAFLGEGEEEVAAHVQKGSFNGVKSVVTKLISSHQDSQKQEKAKRVYCEKEIASAEDEKSDTSSALEAVKATIDKKIAEVNVLADEVKNLYASIAQMRERLKTAGKLRKQEMAQFQAGSKDQALAIKVLNQAVGVLQRFYEKKRGNMLQRGSPPAKWTPGSRRKKVASFGAVSMVQEIADDIAKEQKDTAIQEKQAADIFERLQQDSQQAMDDKQQDITDRVTAKAKLSVQINTYKETRTATSDDLIALTKQLDALHSQCDELSQHFDRREKARSFEVSQLRDVMDILSGAGIAARTGLMQESSQAAQDSSEVAQQTPAPTSEDSDVAQWTSDAKREDTLAIMGFQAVQ